MTTNWHHSCGNGANTLKARYRDRERARNTVNGPCTFIAATKVQQPSDVGAKRKLLPPPLDVAFGREVARIVLHLDPEVDLDRARAAFESYLSRAKWMTEHGYRHLLRGGASA
jgi:hypothetical protein